MQSVVLIDQIDRVNRDVLIDQITGADCCAKVIGDTADVAVFQTGNGDRLSFIPVDAFKGNGGCAEAGLAGVTEAEVDRDRINRCTVELDLEDGSIAIFIGEDIITSDRNTGR